MYRFRIWLTNKNDVFSYERPTIFLHLRILQVLHTYTFVRIYFIRKCTQDFRKYRLMYIQGVFYEFLMAKSQFP